MERDKAFSELIGEILSRGGEVTFSAFGNSMRPLIDSGSVVQIRGCGEQDLRVGDVVLINCGGERKYLIHRVIKISRMGGQLKIFTKGDSSPKDIQDAGDSACVGKLRSVTTGDSMFDMAVGMWRPINRLVACLSRFSALFYGSPLFRRKDKGRLSLPQRLAFSAIYRLIHIGKYLSKASLRPESSQNA